MIVLVKLSARRYMVLDCPTVATAWTSIGTAQDASSPRDQRGWMYSRADIIAGPADLDTCYTAAAQYAEAHQQTIAYTDYQEIEKARAEEIKRINQEIQERRGKSWIDQAQTPVNQTDGELAAMEILRSIDPPASHASPDTADGYSTFETWTEVIAHVTDGCTTYYQAPLDYRPVKVYAKASLNVIRITPPAGSGADPFTADENHLGRFRFRKDRR